MLRIIVALSLLGALEYQTCRGEQTVDWRGEGFYRPRRNYPSQSQNEHSFQANHGQNLQSQNAFRSELSQSSTTNGQNEENTFGINYQNNQKQSSFGSSSQPQYSFGSGSQNSKASDTSKTSFGQNYNQNVFGTSNENTQRPNSFGFNSQNSFGAGYTQKTGRQNALGLPSQNNFARFSENAQGTNNGQNSFGSSFSQLHHNAVKTSSHPLFSSYSQNTQTQNYNNNQKGQKAFGNSGQNIQAQSALGLQSQNAFSTLGSSSGFSKGHNYQGPDYLPPKRFMAPEYLPPKDLTSSTTTRRPFYTTTKRPSYTTTTRRTFYTTTTTKRPFYTTTTTKRPSTVLPAMAMQVPEDDDDNDEILMVPTGNVSPAMAMQVPPEPDDDEEIIDDFITTTKRPVPIPAPAMAIPVPPEEDDPTTTSATPSTTARTSSTTTPDPDNLIEEESSPTTPTQPTTTPSTTTSTTTTTPSAITSTTPSTTTSTTTSTTPSTTPSTTTSTTPSTTTSTATSTTLSTTPSTTTSNTPSTTTSTTTTITTPSTTISTTPSTTTSTTTPSTTTSTTTTTTSDPNRYLIEEESSPTTPPPVTTTPSTTTFKSPDYLPPDNATFPPIPRTTTPKPSIAIPVPPEPECDPLDPSTYPSELDQRYIGDSPYTPITTTTLKPPYKGPLYLPPPEDPSCVPKTRVRRSVEDTLRLGDLPGTPRPVWYAGIYKKVTDPYYPICGGSIVRPDIVISAAHCFWDDVGGKQTADLFAVAASKIYKPWKDPMDKKAQKSDVLEITIPARYLGAKASFQEDIAILKLATPFKYTRGVRPICVDFDVGFDRKQLKAEHYGTIAGWGYTDSKGTPTQRLLWLELPYIEIEKCISDSEESFLKYITSDKVCAGENDTGKALCRGDSGGGLVFWEGPASHATPYLRGVASTAPTDKNAACNVFAYGSFTWLYAHRTFLRDHVPDIDTCRFWE